MTGFFSEQMLVGLIGLALLPLIARRILRGLNEGSLPLYRSHVRREEGRSRFNLLLGLHALSFLLVAAIAADLLFNLGFRSTP